EPRPSRGTPRHLTMRFGTWPVNPVVSGLRSTPIPTTFGRKKIGPTDQGLASDRKRSHETHHGDQLVHAQAAERSAKLPGPPATTLKLDKQDGGPGQLQPLVSRPAHHQSHAIRSLRHEQE